MCESQTQTPAGWGGCVRHSRLLCTWHQGALYLVVLCGAFVVPETLFLLAFLVRSGHRVQYPGWGRLSARLVRPGHWCWPLVLPVVYTVPLLAWVCVMLVIGATALKVGQRYQARCPGMVVAAWCIPSGLVLRTRAVHR
jgi:hypothetical protein